MCNILGKTDQSVSQKVVTIVVPLYLIIVLIMTLIFYFKLLSLNKSYSVLDDIKRRKRAIAVTRNVILVGITNIIC